MPINNLVIFAWNPLFDCVHNTTVKIKSTNYIPDKRNFLIDHLIYGFNSFFHAGSWAPPSRAWRYGIARSSKPVAKKSKKLYLRLYRSLGYPGPKVIVGHFCQGKIQNSVLGAEPSHRRHDSIKFAQKIIWPQFLDLSLDWLTTSCVISNFHGH